MNSEQIRENFINIDQITRNRQGRGHSEASNCIESPDSVFCSKGEEYMPVMNYRGVPLVQGREENHISFEGNSTMRNQVAYAGLLEYGYFIVGHTENWPSIFSFSPEEVFGAHAEYANGENLMLRG